VVYRREGRLHRCFGPTVRGLARGQNRASKQASQGSQTQTASAHTQVSSLARRGGVATSAPSPSATRRPPPAPPCSPPGRSATPRSSESPGCRRARRSAQPGPGPGDVGRAGVQREFAGGKASRRWRNALSTSSTSLLEASTSGQLQQQGGCKAATSPRLGRRGQMIGSPCGRLRVRPVPIGCRAQVARPRPRSVWPRRGCVARDINRLQ